MAYNLIKKKKGEHFRLALLIVVVSISVSILAFMSEDNKITGQVTSEVTEASTDLMEFNSVRDLGTLAPGRYYIDGNGIVYWMENGLVKIAKIKYLDSSEKGKQIYIDAQGNVGFLIG